jgi:pyrroline-5-carboxylate reductase
MADVTPGELARRVASPGGTTERGLDVLDADRALASLVMATLRAAAERSKEMASLAEAPR